MNTKRSALYDNMKLFLICCVVLGHLGNRYADKSAMVGRAQFWIYLFHMPAFIFISGMFSKRTIQNRRWSKAVPYIFLYLGMLTMSFAFSVFTKGIENSSVNYFGTNGPAWFSLAMFWWYTVTILVDKVHPAYVLSVSVFLALISGYYPKVDNFLIMQRSINFYPFFYLGYIMDPIKVQKILKQRKIQVLSFVALAISVLISFRYYEKIKYWRLLFRGLRSYDNIKKGLPYVWGWSWRLSAYVISLVLTFAIISLMPDISCFLSKLGKRTLPVYVFHNVFMSLILRIGPVGRWVSHGHLALHCIIFMCLIVFVTSLPPFEWVTRLIMNVPMKKKNN